MPLDIQSLSECGFKFRCHQVSLPAAHGAPVKCLAYLKLIENMMCLH